MVAEQVVKTQQQEQVMLVLKAQSALSGPALVHSHIWQESKEQSCLQKLKTIKWLSTR
jgi:hypothetical protein